VATVDNELVELCQKIGPGKLSKDFLSETCCPDLQYIQRRRSEAQRAPEPYFVRRDVDLLRLVTGERNARGMMRAFDADWSPITNDSPVPWAVHFERWTASLNAIRVHHQALVPFVPPADDPKYVSQVVTTYRTSTRTGLRQAGGQGRQSVVRSS
jgi:hypothetical protein